MLATTFFPDSVPPRPNGRYAHIMLLRETNSYALFQTDGDLRRQPRSLYPERSL